MGTKRTANLEILRLARLGELTKEKFRKLITETPEGISSFWLDPDGERLYGQVPIMIAGDYVFVVEPFNYINRNPVHICIGKFTDAFYKNLDSRYQYNMTLSKPATMVDIVIQNIEPVTFEQITQNPK